MAKSTTFKNTHENIPIMGNNNNYAVQYGLYGLYGFVKYKDLWLNYLKYLKKSLTF